MAEAGDVAGSTPQGKAVFGQQHDAVRLSQPTYKARVDRHVRVLLRDGVELAAVVVRPDADGRFPAIMSYTPYRWLPNVNDAHSDLKYNHRWDGPTYFAERGYAVVYFDVRGTGNSAGSSQDIYSDQERRDAYDMVEWIAAQPWCDGNVGMWGMSYGGVVQWQVGVQNPPHLKTLVVGSSNDDVYLDWTYPGGALRPYMFDTFSPLMTAMNFAPPDIELVGEKWSDIWRERLEKNVPWGLGFITHQQHGSYWTSQSLQPDYSRIKVPVMLWSGWADCYPTPILRAFSKIKVPKRVLVGPWGHYWPEEAVPGPRIDGRRELLKWFDQWLKGKDTGVMQEPPVVLWVRKYKEPEERMYIEDAGFWRHEAEWPLARAQSTEMHLHPGGKLSRQAYDSPQEVRDSYTYDPAVGITAGIYWGGGIQPYAMPLDQRYDEAYSLNYTTPPLEQDTEATGDPRAILYISSTADTAYFHVKITDVAPDGTSKWVNDGGLLATHRSSHAQPEPLEPSRVYELAIELKYMAYVFQKGHRIRVSIASADFQNAWPTPKAAVNAVHLGTRYPSRVALPFAPPQKVKLPAPDLRPSPRPELDPEDYESQFGKREHRIVHDLVNETVTVHLGRTAGGRSAYGNTQTETTARSSYTVSRKNPADASLNATHEYTLNRPDGTIKVEAHEVVASDISSFRYLTQVQVTVNGKRHFNKSWRVSVPRKGN